MFHRRSSAPNSAFSAAIRMSASNAVSSPAANAYFTGLKMSALRV